MDSCLPVDFLLIRSLFVEVTQFVKNEKSRLYSLGKSLEKDQSIDFLLGEKLIVIMNIRIFSSILLGEL